MWNGWLPGAPQLARIAYRLSKMENEYSLRGQATEEAVIWILNQARTGRVPSSQEAYERAAAPFLRRAWRESAGEKWRQDPKQYKCLHEHYYGTLSRDRIKEWAANIKDHVQRCIDNFILKVLPKVVDIREDQLVDYHKPGDGGDPEHFLLDGIKIYAIPDFAYRAGSDTYIHDWKSGKIRESHDIQMGVYGLWVMEKYGACPESIQVILEYLAAGKRRSCRLDEGEIETVKDYIYRSVKHMRQYLVNGDLDRNEPLPKEAWPVTASKALCRYCSFLELCQAEIAGANIHTDPAEDWQRG